MTDWQTAEKILKELYALHFPDKPPMERPDHDELVIVLDNLREYARCEVVSVLKELTRRFEATS